MQGVLNKDDIGKIYVLDMGQPIKIIDLARQIIMLAGLRPDEDIKIEITGLRPGEKELAETYRYGEKLFDILGLRVETFENRDPKNLDYVNGLFLLCVLH